MSRITDRSKFRLSNFRSTGIHDDATSNTVNITDDNVTISANTVVTGTKLTINNVNITSDGSSVTLPAGSSISGEGSVADRMQVANTQSLVNARLGATSTVTLTGDVTAGSTAFSSNAVSISTTIASNSVDGSKLTDNITIAENLTVSGNLTISGTTTTVNTETINLADNTIKLNSNLSGATAPTQNAGIAVNRGSSANVEFVWNETNDYWTVGAEDLFFGDNAKAIFGAGSDLEIYHNGTESLIDQVGNGNLLIRNTTPDSDVLIYSDDGSGGEALYIQADGSNGRTRLYNYGSEKLSTRTDGIVVTGTITFDGGTTSADLNFGDNDKAVFGNKVGGDLVIFHDGSDSYITDLGTGNLRIGATNLKITNAADTQVYIDAFESGAVNLRYNNNQKLATTATGIDVTGTVTADGLTVDGIVKTNDTVPKLVLNETDTTDLNTYFFSNNGVFSLSTSDDAFTANTRRLSVDHSTGDISFYDDTGVTQGFFWDASAESLGIGTTSPGRQLEIYDDGTNGQAELAITSQNTDASRIFFADPDDNNIGILDYHHSDDSMRFTVNNSEAMRIDSSGNVGIGTTSPSAPLHTIGINGLPATSGTTQNNAFRIGAPATNVVLDSSSNGGNGVWLQATNQTDLSLNYPLLLNPNGGLVGIGTSSPSRLLSLNASNASIDFSNGTWTNEIINSAGQMEFRVDHTNAVGSSLMKFSVDGSEAMRIDSSGNLLVGKTVQSIGTVGVTVVSGQVTATADGADAIRLNRKTSDGSIIDLRQDGTTVGSIGSNSGDSIFIGNGVAGLRFRGVGLSITPFRTDTEANYDNALDLGVASVRFDDIYATNGTIQTSDANEKQDIEALSDAEQRVAAAAKGLLRKYRWKSSVAEKGDEARIHFGIIAQDLQAAFEAEGLDAGRYAMFINSEWTDEETGKQRSRMGVRYNQLLAFIIAAI